MFTKKQKSSSRSTKLLHPLMVFGREKIEKLLLRIHSPITNSKMVNQNLSKRERIHYSQKFIIQRYVKFLNVLSTSKRFLSP